MIYDLSSANLLVRISMISLSFKNFYWTKLINSQYVSVFIELCVRVSCSFKPLFDIPNNAKIVYSYFLICLDLHLFT